MDTLEAFNQALFLAINGTPATLAWQIGIALLIADYLIYLIPLLLVGLWLWGNDAQRSLAIQACLVTMLGVGANQLIGLV
jgi:undecaprenyl-diphosphatase